MTENLYELWDLHEDRWSSVVNKEMCEDFPFHVSWYWKTFHGADDEFLISRRCNVTEPVDYPWKGNLDHWIDYDFFACTIVVGIIIVFLRSLLTNLVFLPIAERFVTDKAKITSFCESMIKVVFYGFAWSSTFYVLWDEPFFWEPKKIMDHHTLGNLHEIPYDFYLLYSLEMGWYLQCLITHFTHDTHKEDHLVMLTHHFVTLSLIYCSLKSGYVQYGTLVLFSMDLCDVFLEFLRALRRITSLPDWAETCLYIPLPLSWFLLRILFYCYFVFRHSLLLVPVMGTGWEECNGYFLFNFLLGALLLMNLYWFFLIMKIAYDKVICGVVLDDTREKSD